MLNRVDNVSNLIIFAEEVFMNELVVFGKEDAEVRMSVNPTDNLLPGETLFDFCVDMLPCFMSECKRCGRSITVFCFNKAVYNDVCLVELFNNSADKNAATFVCQLVFCELMNLSVSRLRNVNILVFFNPFTYLQNVLGKSVFCYLLCLFALLCRLINFLLCHIYHSNISMSKSVLSLGS